MTETAIPCVLMRGGTSKGLYFHAEDLPKKRAIRDRVLLAAMGSPDPRQIDGLGGAHSLTSKVAVISPASRNDADVDYLFLQVVVDSAEVRDVQNCGNILAGVGGFAIEKGLVPATDPVTRVRIHMVNSNSIVAASVETPGGVVNYQGSARIDGVPGSAAPVMLDFLDVAGASCGSLLPTGAPLDMEQGVPVTCIDNGMPVVIMRATDLDKTGHELPNELEADESLKERVEAIRLALGPRMNLGDVTDKTVPKMCLVAPPQANGAISTRTFIPHRIHDSIGVFGAVSIATACLLAGTIANDVYAQQLKTGTCRLDVEHPMGFLTVEVDAVSQGDEVSIMRSALLRTARKLMQGDVYVPGTIWSRT